MSAAGLGLLDAIAGKQIKRHTYGAFAADVTVEGITLSITYDLEGVDLPATETDPAEYAQIVVVSVAVGEREVFGAEAAFWDDLLSLWDLIGEQRT